MRLLNWTNGRAAFVALLGIMGAGVPAVSAQDLADPTAPPPVLRSVLEDRPTTYEEGDNGQTDNTEPRSGPVMIVRRLVAGDWRSRALMDGTLVGPGAEVEAGRVVAIGRNSMRFGNAEGMRNMEVIDGGVTKRRPGTHETGRE